MTMSYARHVALFFLAIGVFLGCTSSPPLVSHPPTDGVSRSQEGSSMGAHTPEERFQGEVSSSEEEYGRAMMRPYSDRVSSDPHSGQPFQGPEILEADAAEGSKGVIGAIADIVAFPFRAVGWLLQSIF